jgi:predicted nucleic acid-binding protein
MVLVDTSVWVSHLRHGNEDLQKLLHDGEVACHPFIVGELACGNLRNRDEILTYLQSLPMTILAGDKEVLKFIDNNQLMGKGLGYIDVHLIASALLTNALLWTLDKTLNKFAEKIDINY